MSNTWDVIVVGAGPAGSAAAALLARGGRRVLVLDAARFPRRKACAEYISPGGVAILERLGALERIDASGRRRWLRGMQVHAPSGACYPIEYHATDGRAHRGLSVSRFVLDPALVAIAREQGAEVREGFRVRDLYQHDGRVQGVVGPSGERLVADLVVGADGLHSVVARAIGASRTALWPRRLGLVAHFEGVDWPEEHGRMLVGRGTYVGIAPLDEHGLVTVGLVRAMPRGHLGSPESAFEAVLSEYPAIAERVRRGRRTGTVVGIGPLARRVRTCAGPGFALVGDAAGFFDPFTGEGIFRALRSAELLADCPRTYARERRRRFAAKERLVALVQVLVQTPALMDLTVRRLQHRPNVARALGLVLGDLQPARLTLVWRLLAP